MKMMEGKGRIARAPVNNPRTNATNVKTGGFGVTGNGSTNDSAGISAAITAAAASTTNLWNGYHVLYFPGDYTYLCGDVSKNVNNVMLIGDGRRSVIKQVGGSGGVITFSGSTGLYIRDLAWDMNNVAGFGGLKFYSVDSATIERNHFYDSASPRAMGGNDRYSCVFGNGGAAAPSTNVVIIDNLIEDLQLEVDQIKHAFIARNVSRRSPTTAAIGCWTVDNSGHVEDVTIKDNLIIDAHQYGIAILKDNASYTNTVIKRVSLINNHLIINRSALGGIVVGVLDLFTDISGDIYNDITVEGNVIEYMIGANAGPSEPPVTFMGSAVNNTNFLRARIIGNQIIGNHYTGRWAFDLRRISTGSIVEGNHVTKWGHGMTFPDGLKGTVIRDNHVDVITYGYNISDCDPAGGNLFTANTYSGAPTTVSTTSNLGAGDVVDAPTLFSPAVMARGIMA